MTNNQRPLLLIILVLYVFTPSILQWITEADGNWYRPFLVWLLVIVAAFALQGGKKSDDV